MNSKYVFSRANYFVSPTRGKNPFLSDGDSNPVDDDVTREKPGIFEAYKHAASVLVGWLFWSLIGWLFWALMAYTIYEMIKVTLEAQ